MTRWHALEDQDSRRPGALRPPRMAASQSNDGLEKLGRAELHCVCLLLAPADLARLCCVSRNLLALCSDDFLWFPLCSSAWRLSAPTRPDGSVCTASRVTRSPFHAAYGAWFASFGRYAPLYARGHDAVTAIRSLCDRELPAVSATLLPGASEQELDAFATKLGVTLTSPALRLIWRLLGGQRLRGTPQWAALFGAFGAYDSYTLMYMLDFETVSHLGITAFEAGGPRWVPFAAGQTMVPDESGVLLVNSATGAVKLNAAGRIADAAPPGPHGILRWVEAFAERCRSGDLSVERCDPENPASMCISSFPRLPPLLSDCVTLGLRVQASAVHAAAAYDPRRGSTFVYRVRFKLLSEQQQVERGVPLSRVMRTAQLQNRHWIITDGEGRTSEVRGDGVVGMYPLLTAGGPEFMYQSMTFHQGRREGSMRGSFGFKPDTGPPFQAVCSPFPLRFPDFLM